MSTPPTPALSPPSPPSSPNSQSFADKVKENAHGFRDSALQTFAALANDDREALILMTAHLADLPTKTPSKDWAAYARTLARAYDVAKFEDYRVLTLRTRSALYSLTHAPSSHSTSPGYIPPLSPAAAYCASGLRSWISSELVPALHHTLVRIGPQAAQTIISQASLDAIAQEHALLSCAWLPEFSDKLVAAGCRCDASVFCAFTSTPRYMFLMDLKRVAAAVSAQIEAAVPHDVAAAFRLEHSQQEDVVSLGSWLEFLERRAASFSNNDDARACAGACTKAGRRNRASHAGMTEDLSTTSGGNFTSSTKPLHATYRRRQVAIL